MEGLGGSQQPKKEHNDELYKYKYALLSPFTSLKF